MNLKKLFAKKFTIIFSLLASIFIISCQKQNILKDGKYTLENSELGYPNITLKKNGEFTLNLSVTSSFYEYGKYIIDKDEVILEGQNDTRYIFEIDNNNLIFKSGKILENIIEKDSAFIHSN